MSKVNSINHSITKAFVVLCCITVMIFGAVLSGCAGNAKAASNSSDSASAKSTSAAGFPVKVTFNVDADGYTTGTSTPVFVNITAKNGNPIYHAIDANTEQSIEVAEPGDYSVSFVSPINADGSIYTVPDNNFTFNVSNEGVVSVSDNKDYNTTSTESDEKIEKTSKNSNAVANSDIAIKFEKVEADKVTKEQLENLQSDIAKAIENGDHNIKKYADDIKATVEKNVEVATTKAKDTAANSTDGTSNEKGKDAASTANSNGGTSNTDASSQSNAGTNSDNSGATQQNSGDTFGVGANDSNMPSYEERMHPATDPNVHHHDFSVPIIEISTYSTVVCNNCGAEFDSPGSWASHGDAANHGSYSVVQHIVEETVGYQCECGATS